MNRTGTSAFWRQADRLPQRRRRGGRACRGIGNRTAGFNHRWYGEPGPDLRAEFMLQARLMDLDELTSASSFRAAVGTLLAALRESAFDCWSGIREDESCAELLIENAEPPARLQARSNWLRAGK